MTEKIKIRCEVREYPEHDGAYHTLIVRNHWNRSDRVIFELGGKEYTFLVYDLKQAIDSACKAH